MSTKIFSVLVLVGTVFSWLAWGMVIFYFDPSQIGLLGFSIFYLSLFLALSGIIFTILDRLKAKFFRKQLLLSRLRSSVRHAILFSILIIGWGFLKSQNLLSWWVLPLFILILTGLEFFFISSQKKNNFYTGQNEA